MIDIPDMLGSFIGRSADTDVVWGESDCTSWAASWIEIVHGRPVSRPRWSSREEAEALILKAGSLDALWADVLGAYGLRRSYGAPEPGDIGIIDTRIAGPVGVIFIHDKLAAWRGEPRGARALRPRNILGVWALQCD